MDKVLILVRDEMPKLVPYLNDVEEILVLEKREEADAVHYDNLWRASSNSAPVMVRKFLSPELLSWRDIARWPQGKTHAEWRLEPKVGSSLFECTGTTSLIEVPGGVQFKIEGDLNIYPERVPGVPRLLAGRLRSKIEAWVVDMIVPNLQTMARGVQAYFDDLASGLGDVD
jgi:hypothetical protein